MALLATFTGIMVTVIIFDIDYLKRNRGGK